MMNRQAKRFYIFGVFRVDVTERILFGKKGVVPLTPKAFDILLALVEASGHVLSQEELMAKVWPDSFVEVNNLAQNISILRKALSKEDSVQKYIQTVPKRGYRFIAEVSESWEGALERTGLATNNKMRAGYYEQQRKKETPFVRDVEIIGRAINFK